MVVRIYATLAGIFMRRQLLNRDGYFTDDYPEERKKMVADVCACLASCIITILLPLII